MCALCYGLEGVYLKYLHKKGIDEYTLVFSLFFFSLPFLIPAALLHGFQPIAPGFIFVLLAVIVGNGMGFFFYSKSIKNTDVSLALPVLSLSPLVVVPFAWIMLGETPSAKGFAGILLIGCGLVALSVGGGIKFSGFFRDKGVKFALITVLIWAVVASLDKMALRFVHPVVYPMFCAAGIAAVFLPFTSAEKFLRKDRLLLLLPLGMINAGLFLTHMLALNTGFVSYIIAVKRSGMIVGVLLGWLLFGERSPGSRLLASIVIVAGIFLLTVM